MGANSKLQLQFTQRRWNALGNTGDSYADTGKATLDYWTGNPWTRGSYSYWTVGQYTAFAGIEGEPAAKTPRSTIRGF